MHIVQGCIPLIGRGRVHVLDERPARHREASVLVLNQGTDSRKFDRRCCIPSDRPVKLYGLTGPVLVDEASNCTVYIRLVQRPLPRFGLFVIPLPGKVVLVHTHVSELDPDDSDGLMNNAMAYPLLWGKPAPPTALQLFPADADWSA
ncbi:hypothetical protein PG994_003912 [Apiospora phragmitis]|uniref:Uncharacterized protein n=1 Tax=Apiospora phragmitis TaxID=2905665 RepID=A0ABR1W2F4_9PEZI